MTNGWIKLHRKSIDSRVFQNPELWKLWCLCLLLANHEKKFVHTSGVTDPVQVNPGQFITGRFALHQKYYAQNPPDQKSPLTLWRWLKKLEQWGSLNIVTNNKFTLVTIVNWELYQSNGDDLNNKRTSDEQQMNTNKKDKEYIRNIYSFWNSLSHTMTHRKLTTPMEKAITARLKDYSAEELKTAMSNYDKVIGDTEYWFSYSKWTLADFLSRGEGKQVDKFLSGIDGFRRTLANGQRKTQDEEAEIRKELEAARNE